MRPQTADRGPQGRASRPRSDNRGQEKRTVPARDGNPLLTAVCSLRSAVVCAGMLLLASTAYGHHILGIPHYAYNEEYPQTPVLTYRVETGRYDLRMTGYPGHPRPGERTSLHVYVKEMESGALFDGTVTVTVRQDRMIGEDPIIYGPVAASLEERIFRFHPEFPEAANYTVHIAFEADGEPWTIDLSMVAGEPGSPWSVLGGITGGVVFFLVMVRAVRIKMRRRRIVEGRRPPAAGRLPA